MCRKHHDRLGKLGARLQQGVELTTFAKAIETPKSGDHPLLTSPLLPAILDDLKVNTVTRLLLTEKHGDFPVKLTNATMKLSLRQTLVNALSSDVAP